MNFEEAITAHSQWKIRLQGVVAGTSKEVLDPKIVGVDDKCALGQWIHGEARQFSTHKEYAELLAEHARFHRCAADVLRAVAAGHTDQAKTMVDGGEFHDVSLRTINAIRHLRKKVQG
jgi:hypothetical protein